VGPDLQLGSSRNEARHHAPILPDALQSVQEALVFLARPSSAIGFPRPAPAAAAAAVVLRCERDEQTSDIDTLMYARTGESPGGKGEEDKHSAKTKTRGGKQQQGIGVGLRDGDQQTARARQYGAPRAAGGCS